MTRSSKLRLLGFASSLALLPALSFTGESGVAVAADSGGHGDAASCQAMAGASLGNGMSVTAAEYHADGAIFGRTKVSLPFCRIVGVARPSADSNIGFEIWLPPASSWNGKYQQEGSGGSS